MNRSEAGKLGAIKSQITQRTQQQQRIDDYNQNPTKCKNCDTSFPYGKRHNKFCNQSCAATYNNKKYPKRTANTSGKNQHSSDFIPKVYNYCLFCGKKLDKKQSKFCNGQCQQDYKWRIRKQQIIDDNGFCYDNRRAARKFLIETKGHHCQVCGITEWNAQPAPLVLDHIDGNSDNNILSNLRLVCGNCDMQLPTYKSKNNGNGRAKRRQRYYDGKSY